MKETEKLTQGQLAAAREKRLTAMHLQEIEANPLSADDVAMFEMFEREAWSHERRVACIRRRVTEQPVPDAAE